MCTIICTGKTIKNIATLDEFLSKFEQEDPMFTLEVQRDSDGYTLLHHAVMEQNLDKIKYLTNPQHLKSKRISPTVMHGNSYSLNHFAVLYAKPGEEQTCIEILKYFSSEDRGEERIPYNIKLPDGSMPIHLAAISLAFDVINFLASDECGREKTYYSCTTNRTDGLISILDIVVDSATYKKQIEEKSAEIEQLRLKICLEGDNNNFDFYASNTLFSKKRRLTDADLHRNVYPRLSLNAKQSFVDLSQVEDKESFTFGLTNK